MACPPMEGPSPPPEWNPPPPPPNPPPPPWKPPPPPGLGGTTGGARRETATRRAKGCVMCLMEEEIAPKTDPESLNKVKSVENWEILQIISNQQSESPALFPVGSQFQIDCIDCIHPFHNAQETGLIN